MAKSRAFVALLPESIDEIQLERLFTWGRNNSERADVVMTNHEGVLKLICIRREAKTARDYPRLLRTLLVKWQVDLPAKMTDWLRLIDEDQYDILRIPGGSVKPELTIDHTDLEASDEETDGQSRARTQNTKADTPEAEGEPEEPFKTFEPPETPSTRQSTFNRMVYFIPKNLLSNKNLDTSEVQVAT